jgi:hypothetical protein
MPLKAPARKPVAGFSFVAELGCGTTGQRGRAGAGWPNELVKGQFLYQLKEHASGVQGRA